MTPHEPITKKELKDELDVLRKQRESDINTLRSERKEDMAAIKDDMKGMIKDIMAVLQPLSDTYETATRMGKWFMAIAVFLSIILGIILSIKSLGK